jgi:hypothetical protein
MDINKANIYYHCKVVLLTFLITIKKLHLKKLHLKVQPSVYIVIQTTNDIKCHGKDWLYLIFSFPFLLYYLYSIYTFSSLSYWYNHWNWLYSLNESCQWFQIFDSEGWKLCHPSGLLGFLNSSSFRGHMG